MLHQSKPSNKRLVRREVSNAYGDAWKHRIKKFELRAKYRIPFYYEGKLTEPQHAWGLEQINVAYNN